MEEVGARTYRLGRSEFPLSVEITVDGLPVNRAVVGHQRFFKALSLVKTVSTTVHRDPTGMVLSFEMALPAPPQPYEPPPFDITCHIQAFFDQGAGEDARYLVTIKNRSNQQQRTEMFSSGLNPVSAMLRFQIR
jgi:hypothetical protein